MNSLSVHLNNARVGMKGYFSDLNGYPYPSDSPAYDRLDSGNEILPLERPGQIIVSTEIEAAHDPVGLHGIAKDQDRRASHG